MERKGFNRKCVQRPLEDFREKHTQLGGIKWFDELVDRLDKLSRPTFSFIVVPSKSSFLSGIPEDRRFLRSRRTSDHYCIKNHVE